MTESTKALSPLRQRMIEDMRMRKLAVGTQSYYIQAVKNLARYLGRSPATASAEDLRRYQLYLVDRGTSRSTVNRTITGLRFFFEVTLARDDALSKMKPVHEPRRLPVVLSVEEVTRLLKAAPPRQGQSGTGGGLWGGASGQRSGSPQSQRYRQ